MRTPTTNMCELGDLDGTLLLFILLLHPGPDRGAGTPAVLAAACWGRCCEQHGRHLEETPSWLVTADNNLGRITMGLLTDK